MIVSLIGKIVLFLFILLAIIAFVGIAKVGYSKLKQFYAVYKKDNEVLREEFLLLYYQIKSFRYDFKVTSTSKVYTALNRNIVVTIPLDNPTNITITPHTLDLTETEKRLLLEFFEVAVFLQLANTIPDEAK